MSQRRINGPNPARPDEAERIPRPDELLNAYLDSGRAAELRYHRGKIRDVLERGFPARVVISEFDYPIIWALEREIRAAGWVVEVAEVGGGATYEFRITIPLGVELPGGDSPYRR